MYIYARSIRALGSGDLESLTWFRTPSHRSNQIHNDRLARLARGTLSRSIQIDEQLWPQATPNVRVALSELWTSNTPLQALTDQRSQNPYRLQKTTSLTPKPYRPHSNPRNPNPTTPRSWVAVGTESSFLGGMGKRSRLRTPKKGPSK